MGPLIGALFVWFWFCFLDFFFCPQTIQYTHLKTENTKTIQNDSILWLVSSNSILWVWIKLFHLFQKTIHQFLPAYNPALSPTTLFLMQSLYRAYRTAAQIVILHILAEFTFSLYLSLFNFIPTHLKGSLLIKLLLKNATVVYFFIRQELT